MLIKILIIFIVFMTLFSFFWKKPGYTVLLFFLHIGLLIFIGKDLKIELSFLFYICFFYFICTFFFIIKDSNNIKVDKNLVWIPLLFIFVSKIFNYKSINFQVMEKQEISTMVFLIASLIIVISLFSKFTEDKK